MFKEQKQFPLSLCTRSEQAVPHLLNLQRGNKRWAEGVTGAAHSHPRYSSPLPSAPLCGTRSDTCTLFVFV